MEGYSPVAGEDDDVLVEGRAQLEHVGEGAEPQPHLSSSNIDIAAAAGGSGSGGGLGSSGGGGGGGVFTAGLSRGSRLSSHSALEVEVRPPEAGGGDGGGSGGGDGEAWLRQPLLPHQGDACVSSPRALPAQRRSGKGRGVWID